MWTLCTRNTCAAFAHDTPEAASLSLHMGLRDPSDAVRALTDAYGIRYRLWQTTRAAETFAILAAHRHVSAHTCHADD